MISTCLYFRGTLPIPEKKWKLTLHEYTIDRVGNTSEIMKNKVTFLEKYAQGNKPTKRFVTWHQLQLDDKSLIAIPRSTDASLPRLAAKCLTPHLKRQMATSEIIAAIGDQSKLKTIKYCSEQSAKRGNTCASDHYWFWFYLLFVENVWRNVSLSSSLLLLFFQTDHKPNNAIQNNFDTQAFTKIARTITGSALQVAFSVSYKWAHKDARNESVL